MASTLKILHLEDNVMDAELVASWLSDNGWQCDIVRVDTKEEFLTMLGECSFDLIFADRTTPAFDGLSALALAQELRRDIPFIFVSGTLDEELAIATLRNGATDYVLKHRLSRLVPAVERALGDVQKRRDLERASLALREQAELLDRANDMIIIRDLADRVTYWNRGAERGYGWAREQAVGSNLHDLLKTKFPLPLEEVQAALLQTDHWEGQLEHERADGGRVIVSSHWTLRRDASGNPASILEINADLTEQWGLQQQLLQVQKLESLGTLAGGIAHDFNNILSIILGYASIIGTVEPRSGEIDEMSGMIVHAGERGASLVRQLLTFARKDEVLFTAVQVNAVIEDIFKMLQQTFPKSIAFKKDLSPGLRPIRADASQVHQVLLNLCVNARDAMPSGGTLSITSEKMCGTEVRRRHPEAADEDHVVVRVSDTGTGMDAATQERIFEPFFTTKEAGKGTGLGLAVVYGVIQGHRGFIHIESEVGKGTTFCISFPIADDESEVVFGERIGPEPAGKNELILVVEDEKMLRDLVKNVLSSRGYRVVTARDGLEAIEVSRVHGAEIALVLCDLGLPKLGGLQMYLQMRESGINPKMLLCSGYLEPQLRAKLLAAGVTDFLPKPFRPAQVLAKVREILDAQP